MAYSFTFPTMINKNTGGFEESSRAATIKQNIKLLLSTSKGELLGDPYFGVNLKRLLFDPNDVVLKDIVIDDIYLAIKLFVKEISIERKNIRLNYVKNRGGVEINLKFLYNIDGSNDMYSITLNSSGGLS